MLKTLWIFPVIAVLSAAAGASEPLYPISVCDYVGGGEFVWRNDEN